MSSDHSPKLPKGRTLKEFMPLRTAETKLLSCAAEGSIAEIGSSRPESETAENSVRAAFIRFLILGGDGDAPVHEKGVWLHGAWITGVLDLSGTRSKGGVFLVHSTFAEQPTFFDARIMGSLFLNGSQLPGMSADRLICDATLQLGGGFQATNEVNLLGATIGGNFSCRNGSFQNPGNEALCADRLKVGGTVNLQGFSAQGKVRFLNATIGGNFSCSKASFQNSGKNALSADGLKVGGDVSLKDGFAAQGDVRFLGATIDGNFSCRNGSFQNPGKDALSADSVRVGGDVLLDEGFEAQGGIRFLGATIDGNFSCRNGTFQNPGNEALSADSVRVGGDVLLDEGFEAQGGIRFIGATIDGDLACGHGSFRNTFGDSLTLQRANIAGTLFFEEVTSCTGGIDLAGATVSRLVDDEKSWPEYITLDGFRYEAFAGESPISATMRRAWLDKQAPRASGKNGAGGKFRPQPWLQLRDVLRASGHYEMAREIGIAFERRKRFCGLIGGTSESPAWWCPGFLWPTAQRIYRIAAETFHSTYGGLVDYGYRPLKLVLISLFVWVICTGVYFIGANNGAFAPSNPLVFQNSAYASCRSAHDGHGDWTKCKSLPPEYAGFFPAIYSLNVLLPVGDLG